MKDLLMKSGHSIACFKKGDIITRLIPAEATREEFNENLGVMVEKKEKYYGYQGQPFEYIGIFNNDIWLKNVMKSDYFFGKTIRLSADAWSEGWDIFELPEGYTLNDI